MKLSILIPMFNAENFIGRCLDSLINQDILEEDYEIIIINDGATDKSSEIVKEYTAKYKNIILYNELNSGAYTTRNKLLKLAKGDYIYGVDADDYIAYHSLGTILHKAMHYDLDIIGFGTKTTTTTNDYHLNAEEKITLEPNLISGVDFLVKYPNHRVEIWWYFIKRSLLIENNLFFEKNEHNADVVFTFKAFLIAKKVIYLDLPIYRYFQSENSITRSENPVKLQKQIEFNLDMVLDLNRLIETSKIESTGKIRSKVLDHLRYRRDHFTFFLIVRCIKFNYLNLHQTLNQLKAVEAYPIKNYIGSKSINYRLLNIVVNNTIMLLFLARIKSLMRL